MDHYTASEHGLSGPGPPPPPAPPPPPPPPPPGTSTIHSPGLLHEQHLQQLHQSLQLQQQQLHQQLTAGGGSGGGSGGSSSSNINDLIGMLPQTAAINTSSSSESAMNHNLPLVGPSSHASAIGGYRPDSGLLPSASPLSFPRHPGSRLTDIGGPPPPVCMGGYTRHTETAPPPSSMSLAFSSRHSESTPLPSPHIPPPPPSQSYPPPSRTSQESNEPGSSGGSLPSPGIEMGPSQGSSISTSTPGAMSASSSQFQRTETSLSSTAFTRQGDRYMCSMCGKMVVSKAAITRHIQLTHEKKKPFECNICHRRFGYKNILLEHQNIHFGIKPYACNLCDKRFAARSNLFQHRLLHMKPYCCYICNKRFDRDDQLQRHLKLHPTANVLSCSQCPFTATNVEALNTHLQETHKLLTYDTRRYSSSMDSENGDMPTQDKADRGRMLVKILESRKRDKLVASMMLPSPSLTSPDKSPGHQVSLSGPINMESDAMRRIDTICTQLASRGQGSHYENMGIKQEPLSPGGIHFPGENVSYHASMSPQRDSQHFNHGSPTSTISNTSNPPRQRLPPFFTTLARSYSNTSDPEQVSPLPMSSGSKIMSPIPGIDSNPNKFHAGAGPRFMPPARRTNSFSSMNQLRHGGTTPEHVRSIADSTSNLTEFFSSLQAWVQRSREIPELNISISKPKLKEDVGVQHNSTNLPGEPPSLEELLVYYESQGSLYRCQHCRISFEERGLYFLHKSLHGEMSPWQCSICHKVCADRNDFHLHFVNQQHL